MSRSTEGRLRYAVAALGLLATLFVAPSASAAPGDLDPSFDGDGIVTTNLGSNETGSAVSIAPNGDLVVAGSSAPTATLVRYRSDGSLDPTFGIGGTVSPPSPFFSMFSDVLHQPDGKIVAGGSAGGIFPCPPVICFFSDFFLARFNTDGSLDTSFGSGGMVDLPVGSFATMDDIELDGSGNIVAGGHTGAFFDPSIDEFALVRVDDSGVLDPSFGTGGAAITSFSGGEARVHSLAIQPDGKIVAAGEAAGDFALARYTSGGALDPTFGSGGQVTTAVTADPDVINSVALYPDGRIAVGGQSATDFALARYESDGAIDTSFGSAGIVTTSLSAGADTAKAIALQPDGTIFAGGIATDGTEDLVLARYTADGMLDASFGVLGAVITPIGSGADQGNDLEIDSSGNIVLVGNSFNGVDNDYALVRYEGSLPEPPPIPTYEVHVKKTGTGSGAIVSDELGIDCGSDCTSRLDRYTRGTLIAVPDEGSKFAGWSGPCRDDAGDAAEECSIELTSPTTVTATFDVLDPTEHARTLEVTRFGHSTSGGETVLVTKGVLTVPDDFSACAASQDIVLQRKRTGGGTWTNKATESTGPDGIFRIVVPDRPGTYRVVATSSEVPPTDTCRSARKRLNHRHP